MTRFEVTDLESHQNNETQMTLMTPLTPGVRKMTRFEITEVENENNQTPPTPSIPLNPSFVRQSSETDEFFTPTQTPVVSKENICTSFEVHQLPDDETEKNIPKFQKQNKRQANKRVRTEKHMTKVCTFHFLSELYQKSSKNTLIEAEFFLKSISYLHEISQFFCSGET